MSEEIAIIRKNFKVQMNDGTIGVDWEWYAKALEKKVQKLKDSKSAFKMLESLKKKHPDKSVLIDRIIESAGDLIDELGN